VLCAELVRHTQGLGRGTVVFFLCNFRRQDSSTNSNFLKVITSQLMRQNQEFAGIAHEEYISQGHTSSVKHLKSLAATLIKAIDYVRIVVDGLDESEEAEQKAIMSSIRALIEGIQTNDASSTPTDIKCAIFSRAVGSLSKLIKKPSTIDLGKEVSSVQQSINMFVHFEIAKIRDSLDNPYLTGTVFENVEQKIVSSAGGKQNRTLDLAALIQDQVCSCGYG
jgi:hypothetical protein